MESDDIAPLPLDPEEDVFEFGDQTICRMRRQPFDLAGNPVNPDDLGSMVIRPLRPAVVAVPSRGDAPPVALRPEDVGEISTITIRPARGRRADASASEERLKRLEAKVDALTQAVETLQKSLNAVQEALAPARS